MHFFQLRLSFPHLPCYHVTNTSLRAAVGYVMECTHFHPTIMHSNYHYTLVKNICLSCTSVSSFPRLHQYGALHIRVDVGETTSFDKYLQSECTPESAEKLASDEKVQLDGYHDSPESFDDLKEKRKRRRRKHGNKGRVPWNKGITHTSETRVLIKQRTIEAMRNPQVRRKMSEHSHSHSNESIAKIRSSLARIWDNRLRWKRSREKFFCSWAESIAEAAKKGGSDQPELEWDSYDRIKQEMMLQQNQNATEKTKLKELVKLRADAAAKAKAEKRTRLVQKRKKQKAKAKSSEQAERGVDRNLKKKTEESSVAKEVTLKHRLKKIRKKKNIILSTSLISGWEKLDLEVIKREKAQKEVSLADQIRAAKNRRTESLPSEALGSTI